MFDISTWFWEYPHVVFEWRKHLKLNGVNLQSHLISCTCADTCLLMTNDPSLASLSLTLDSSCATRVTTFIREPAPAPAPCTSLCVTAAATVNPRNTRARAGGRESSELQQTLFISNLYGQSDGFCKNVHVWNNFFGNHCDTIQSQVRFIKLCKT